jgi:superfamily II DNA or RNA helicase
MLLSKDIKSVNIKKRTLVLRPYQVKPATYCLINDKVVLASAPSSGKTEMAIWIIEQYLKQNPNSRILILAHDTKVLLYNFIQRLNGLNVSFSYSSDLNSGAQVLITIPQNSHKIKGNFDFLIVDEAHENYLAKRVEKLVKRIKPKKELLMTATPSKFIKKGGYNICTLALNQLPDEYLSKLNIELVASEYNWFGNYNAQQNIKSNFKSTHQATKETLENILPVLIERVKSKSKSKRFNFPNIFTKVKNWANIYKSLGKTMIVCNSIEQADLTYNILKSEGVNCCCSHSNNDSDSLIIDKFSENDIDVLIVVDRGRLGYNNTELMNLIDLSGTHNPDLIFQMFCRVIRKSENKNDDKFFIKVTPKNKINMELTHMAVCAALMLTDEKYLKQYNGSNFNNIKIPVLKKQNHVKNSNGSNRKGNSLILPNFTHDVINFFKNIIHNIDKPVSIYEETTIGEVKYKLGFLKRNPGKSDFDIYKSGAGKEAKNLNINIWNNWKRSK